MEVRRDWFYAKLGAAVVVATADWSVSLSHRYEHQLHYRDHVQGTVDQHVAYDEYVGPIADIDGDGHLDVWLRDRMLRGPFLGRDVAFQVGQWALAAAL